MASDLPNFARLLNPQFQPQAGSTSIETSIRADVLESLLSALRRNVGLLPPGVSPLPTLPGILQNPPGGTTSLPAAPSPQATASRLQVLLAALPRADAGQVITSEFHNSLRNAILAIADELDVGLTGQAFTRTFAPALFPSDTGSAWSLQNGIAYFSLEAPNAAELQAKAKAQEESAAAAAAIVVARADDAAQPASQIPPITGNIGNAVGDAKAKAADAATAAHAASAAIADPDAEAKARDSVAKAQAAVAASGAVMAMVAPLFNMLGQPQFFPQLQAAGRQITQVFANGTQMLQQAAAVLGSAQAALNTLLSLIQAQRTDRPSTCAGWLPLDLPETVGIQALTVIGQRTGTTPHFQADLVRQTIADSADTTLISLPLTKVVDAFTASANLSKDLTSPGDATVDTTRYKYLIKVTATLIGGDRVQINAFQVAWAR